MRRSDCVFIGKFYEIGFKTDLIGIKNFSRHILNKKENV